MAGSVIGRQSRTGKQNHGNVLQARASFDDRAQILAGDFLALALCFSKNYVGSLAAQNVERLFRRGDRHDMVTILFQYGAKRARRN
jgi:hypothetical protein